MTNGEWLHVVCRTEEEALLLNLIGMKTRYVKGTDSIDQKEDVVVSHCAGA